MRKLPPLQTEVDKARTQDSNNNANQGKDCFGHFNSDSLKCITLGFSGDGTESALKADVM
jgi:hypothetical protein